MFSIENLSYHYDDTSQLQFPNWQVNHKEQWLLLGPSGQGKSTLLHLLAGLLQPKNGKIIIGEQDITKLSGHVLDLFRGKNIGIVFQKLFLINHLTALDNLLLTQYLAKLPQNKTEAIHLLTALNLKDHLYKKPSALSHGQAQRLALARALINKPKLILADEPTSNLDDEHCVQVLDLLMEQAQHHEATLIIATHDKRIQLPNKFNLGAN